MTHTRLPCFGQIEAHFVHGVGCGVCKSAISGTTSVRISRSCGAHSPVNQHHISKIIFTHIDDTVEILSNYCQDTVKLDRIFC